MTPLTRRDVLAHQPAVPWPSQRQVEQDLLLCRAMVELFNDDFLRTQIAMRGGTLLHKVYLPHQLVIAKTLIWSYSAIVPRTIFGRP